MLYISVVKTKTMIEEKELQELQFTKKQLPKIRM